MPVIEVLDDSGDVVEQQIISRSADIVPENGKKLKPAVVQRVEYDHSGQTSSITTVCGETENRREGDEQPDITIEGILTEPQLSRAKSLKEGEKITLVSDVHEGFVYVKRLTIEQTTDIITYQEGRGGGKELAFTFQLQLGQPGDVND